jgi:hypothetical protein
VIVVFIFNGMSELLGLLKKNTLHDGSIQVDSKVLVGAWDEPNYLTPTHLLYLLTRN